jgi:hypothetical protein
MLLRACLLLVLALRCTATQAASSATADFMEMPAD